MHKSHTARLRQSLLVPALLAACLAPRAVAAPAAEPVVKVDDDAALRRAIAAAKPGSRIVIAPGKYRPGVSASNLRGTPEAPGLVLGLDRGGSCRGGRSWGSRLCGVGVRPYR